MANTEIDKTVLEEPKDDNVISERVDVTLTKDGVSFTLSDPFVISAFEKQGYKKEV